MMTIDNNIYMFMVAVRRFSDYNYMI